MSWEWIKVFIDKFDKFGNKQALVLLFTFAFPLYLLYKEYISKYFFPYFIIISFCFFYLTIGFCCFLLKKIKVKIRKRELDKSLNAEIWKMFSELSEEDIDEVFCNIFEQEKHPYSKCQRIIRKEYLKRKYIDFDFLNKYKVEIPFYTSYNCIEIRENSSSIIFEINPYFYKLISYYRKNSKRKKNIPFYFRA